MNDQHNTSGSTGSTGDDDRRLHLYFEHQAGRVALPDGDAGRIVAHVARRRRTRRTVTGGATAVVLVLGALGLYAGRTEQEVVVGPLSSAPSSSPPPVFTWTNVEVPSGLGWSMGDTVSSDGVFYSLSTAPGRTQPDANGNLQGALYRSSDGKSWTAATLPNGVKPTQIASTPGHLYAVGTGPGAGGGTDLVIATSTDGASSWAETHIPAPAAALKARFPQEVQVSVPRLAAGPGGLTALVSVTAAPMADRLLQARNIPAPAGSGTTPDGVEVYAANDSCAEARGLPAPSTVPPDTTVGATPPTTVPNPDPAAQKLELEQAIEAKAAAGGTIPGGTIPAKEACFKRPEIAATYTWAQLGLEPELTALLKGQTFAYTSTDGQAFTAVAPAPLAEVTGQVVELIGSTDGYRLFTNDMFSSTMTERFSTDGRTWTTMGSIEGWVQATGHLGGQPAVAVNRQDGTSLLIAAPGGGWRAVDVDAALGTGVHQFLTAVALGPLGFVALSFDQTPNDQTLSVIESVDGQRFTKRTLAELGLNAHLEPLGVTMNADAVVVRLTESNAGPEGTVDPLRPQHLLIGTRG